MNTQSRHQPNPLKSTRFVFMISMLLAFVCLSPGSTTTNAQESGAKNLPILEKWNGDFPVAHLGRLPESGNEDGVADILAMETMSARPIADNVAMAMAMIPRTGIQFIQAGNQRIPVSDDAVIPSATDPLNTELKEVKPVGKREQVLEGWVTIGHEVRSFLPCGDKRQLWLLGNSPAFDTVMAAYRENRTSPKPYAPLFMILAGALADAPTDGFGAQYEAAFFTTQLVRVWTKGNCKSEWIYLDSPLPGAIVDSPLTIQGHARGNWFFEGDFPVVLTDSQGAVIAERFATATGDWMTEKFVRFEGAIEFNKPRTGDSGTLILKKEEL